KTARAGGADRCGHQQSRMRPISLSRDGSHLMIALKTLKTLSAVLLSVVALQACDSEVASPGEGAFAPGASTGGGSDSGNGGGTGGGTAAADCPAGFTNVGLVSNSTLRA